MKWIALIVSLLVAGCNDGGQEVVQLIDPAELAESGILPDSIRFVGADDVSSSDYLVIEQSGTDAQRILIATISTPGVTLQGYAVTGEVRYENVVGDAYLMTWNYFPDGPFFSKGIDPIGPAGVISGSSDWRPFVLEFYCVSEVGGDTGIRPSKIELQLVLPGSGKVYVRNMRLRQFALEADALASAGQQWTGAAPLVSTGQWWTGQQAGLVAGILGAVFGCLGGLAGSLESMGRGRRFASAVVIAMIALGVASLILGVVALARSQPYDVYSWLFLFGAVFVLIPASIQPMLRRRYAEMELRKMNAIDAGSPSA